MRTSPPSAPAAFAAYNTSPGAVTDAVDIGRDLVAPIPGAPTAGVVVTFIAAVLTFGLWPALVWPVRFSHLASVERKRLGRVAAWLRSRTAHPEARQLDVALERVHFSPGLYVVAAVACAAVVVLVFLSPVFVGPKVHGYGGLLTTAYSLHDLKPAHWLDPDRRSPFFTGPARKLLIAWTAYLSIAFAAHWVQVHLYARSVRNFLNVFNTIMVHEAMSPVFLQPIGAGVRPFWMAGAVGMVLIGAPWGVPMMLAGAVQRRYARRAGVNLRHGLAAKLRGLSLLHPLAPAPPPPVLPAPPQPSQPLSPQRAAPRMRCATDGCRLPLPAGARFCPRCGKRAAPPLDRVA